VGGAGRLRRRLGGRQAARARLTLPGVARELEIGRTVLGRPIVALHFAAADYARPRHAALLFGAIHGDEPLGVHCLAELIGELGRPAAGRETWIIPALNLDGLAAGSKNNANDVDLNRNFAATSWTPQHKAGLPPRALRPSRSRRPARWSSSSSSSAPSA
jgi:protein MpaA